MNQTGWLPGWSHFSNSITFGDAKGNLSSFLLSWKLTISLWLLLAITTAIDNKFYICSVIFIYTIYVHLQLCWRFKIEMGKNWRVQFRRYFVVTRVFSKRFERLVLDALYRSLFGRRHNTVHAPVLCFVVVGFQLNFDCQSTLSWYL